MIIFYESLLNSTLIRLTRTFTILDLGHLNVNHHLCSQHLKLKLQYDLIHSQPKMRVYILMLNSTKFGTEIIFKTLGFCFSEIIFSCCFISSNTPKHDAYSLDDNPYSSLRIELHDKLPKLTPLFTPTWLYDAFFSLFGYPCYILTHCGNYFLTFFFIQTILTLLIQLCKTVSTKNNHLYIIAILSSITHVFFKFLTAEMVNDLKDAHTQRPLPPNKSSQQLPL